MTVALALALVALAVALEVPVALQIVLLMAAVVGALSVIYLKGLRPLARFIAETERTVPVLRQVTERLSDPNIVGVIVDMAKQFQTDSGSSLRDVVNRLEVSSVKTEAATEELKSTMRWAQSQIMHLLVELGRLQGQGERDTAKIMGAADAAAGHAAGVAVDLQESHDRARGAGGAPGESADAFSTQPEVPE